MASLGWNLAEIAVVGAASIVAGYLVEKIRRARKWIPVIGSSATTRMRIGNSLVRCRFRKIERNDWIFSAPIAREKLPGLRSGSLILAEIPIEDGVLMLSGTLQRVDDRTGDLRVSYKRANTRDRRDNPRLRLTTPVAFERQIARLQDFGALGARILTAKTCRTGERVRLDVPWQTEPIYGWVVGIAGENIRIRFEEAQQLPARRWGSHSVNTAPA